MKARWSKPRPWDALQSFKLKFTDCKWNELDPNDTIYHHMPPVTSLDLTLPSGLEVDTIDDDWIKLYIPSQFLVNLSTLELTCDWHPASILTTLQSCTSLQNLTVALRGNPDLSFKRETLDGPLPEDGLLLPRLRTLRLRYAAVSNISEILDIVNTPSLEELDVNFEMLDDGIKSTISGFDEDILDLIERSKCNLRRLKIHMAVFSDSEELKTILKNLPSLTHLLLNNTIFDLEIFRDLRCNEILPHLKVFEIFDCPTSDNRKLDMLCQFSEVYVRWSFGKGLEIIREERPDRAMKKLYVTLREPVPLDFDRLEHSGVKFRRLDGMEVRFCSIPHDTWPPPHLIDNDY
ncbi:hypothetical protein EST38_g2338 [Candolleomyces aberdarensis]|uniref:Uncharacterized protein n=1 Tax=Candolleomyces aberdarensis TaxID=2316362 RepID=A0A4Q2DUV1_9AGAR|nr:hypothetical protein EST38_g2338 [Candolleomyces aberdarensis]